MKLLTERRDWLSEESVNAVVLNLPATAEEVDAILGFWGFEMLDFQREQKRRDFLSFLALHLYKPLRITLTHASAFKDMRSLLLKIFPEYQ